MAGTGTLEMQGGPARGSQDSPVGPPQQIPTASQLTIFYSGSVNVFHDVPADKAHAIMLLLASGDEKRNRITDGSTMPGASSLEFPAINNRASIPRSFNAPSANLKPPFSGASTPPPSSPFQAPQPEKKPTQLISRRTQAELPFARKASLARFLEKRKDRVQVNAGACSDEGFPDIASKKLKTCDDGIAQSE